MRGVIVPLKWIEYGVYGDLIIIYPKPYSIYLRGTIGFSVLGFLDSQGASFASRLEFTM